MIHIVKSKDKKFYVAVTADNGETLSISETVDTRASAVKNIVSQSKQFSSGGLIRIQDNTAKRPIQYVYNIATKEKTPHKPLNIKPYQP